LYFPLDDFISFGHLSFPSRQLFPVLPVLVLLVLLVLLALGVSFLGSEGEDGEGDGEGDPPIPNAANPPDTLLIIQQQHKTATPITLIIEIQVFF